MIRLVIAAVLMLAAVPADAADAAEWQVYMQRIEGGPWVSFPSFSSNDRCFAAEGASSACSGGLAGDPFATKIVNPATGKTYVYNCERLHALSEREVLEVEPRGCVY